MQNLALVRRLPKLFEFLDGLTCFEYKFVHALNSIVIFNSKSLKDGESCLEFSCNSLQSDSVVDETNQELLILSQLSRSHERSVSIVPIGLRFYHARLGATQGGLVATTFPRLLLLLDFHKLRTFLPQVLQTRLVLFYTANVLSKLLLTGWARCGRASLSVDVNWTSTLYRTSTAPARDRISTHSRRGRCRIQAASHGTHSEGVALRVERIVIIIAAREVTSTLLFAELLDDAQKVEDELLYDFFLSTENSTTVIITQEKE